jgi:DNA-binding response OmpR family regulator
MKQFDRPAARILLVEDDPLVQRMLQATLERHNYIVIATASFDEASTLLRRTSFDLLLTDMLLGTSDGIALVRYARKHDPHIATIVLSGYATLERTIEAIRMGVNDFLLKPTPMAELLKSVARLLEQRQHKQRQSAALVQLQQGLQWLAEGQAEKATVAAQPETLLTANDMLIQIRQLTIDKQRGEVIREGKRLHLSAGDYAILAYLASRADTLITAQQIAQDVLNYSCTPNEASTLIKARICAIRKQIEQQPSRPTLLINVRGAGYMLSTRGY